jgi:hypothetical protein
MLIIPPYPFFNQEFNAEIDLSKAWKVRPQLFFRCTIRPLGSGPESDIPLELMFFSLFEPCPLTKNHPLQQAGMEMLYEPSPIPCLYVGNVENALCRVSLIPCFVEGNSTPTIPQKFAGKKAALFPNGEADTNTRPGSKLFEVNDFMWKYGRPKARTQTVTEAREMRAQKQAAAIRKRSKTRELNKMTSETFSVAFETHQDDILLYSESEPDE